MERRWLDPLWGAAFGLAITAIVGYAATSGIQALYGGTAPDFLAHSRVAQPLSTLPHLAMRL